MTKSATELRLGPLRKVVSEELNDYGVQIERLECGHTVIRKQDAFGHTNAYRRRCWRCRNEARSQ